MESGEMEEAKGAESGKHTKPAACRCGSYKERQHKKETDLKRSKTTTLTLTWWSNGRPISHIPSLHVFKPAASLQSRLQRCT